MCILCDEIISSMAENNNNKYHHNELWSFHRCESLHVMFSFRKFAEIGNEWILHKQPQKSNSNKLVTHIDSRQQLNIFLLNYDQRKLQDLVQTLQSNMMWCCWSWFVGLPRRRKVFKTTKPTTHNNIYWNFSKILRKSKQFTWTSSSERSKV